MIVYTTIDNTGTYSGIARGIYYNPTLTSITGTHRAWENTTGDMVFNSTSGVVMIGSTVSTAEKLQVTGTAKITGTSTISGITLSGQQVSNETGNMKLNSQTAIEMSIKQHINWRR